MYQYINPYFAARLAQITLFGIVALKLHSPPYERVYWNSEVKRL